eukprot:COSAG04_NODE_2430_length_4143_cov_4.576980_1_plen_294_part_10
MATRGYLLTQLPAGWLAQRFGAKLVLTLNMAGTAVLFSLLPSAVRAGGAASTLPVAGLLTTMGLCQGGLIPAEAAINREWLAGMEPTARAWMLRVLGFAHQLCHLLATWATPRLASSGRGWPAVCAVYGGSAAVVTVLWQLFAASHPTASRQPKPEQPQQPKQEEEKEPEKTVVSSSSLLRFLKQPEALSKDAGHAVQEWGVFRTGAVMSIMLCEMAYNNLTLTIETWAPTALADRFALCANLPPHPTQTPPDPCISLFLIFCLRHPTPPPPPSPPPSSPPPPPPPPPLPPPPP